MITHKEFKKAWKNLTKEQKDKVRTKAKWERVTLWKAYDWLYGKSS